MTPSIDINFTKCVDVERLMPQPAGHVEEYETYLTDVACHIQPLDDAWTLDEVGAMGKEWIMFCARKDIKERDRILYDGEYYDVVSLEDHDDFLGISRHMEMRIRKHIKQND